MTPIQESASRLAIKMRRSPYRIVLLSTVVLVMLAVLSTHEVVDHPATAPKYLEGLFEGWPGGALSISIALLTLLFVDSVRSQAEKIEEALQHRLRSFEEIHMEALALLEWVTDEPPSEEVGKTAFYMTSATPVFGLEAKSTVKARWKELLEKRRAANADTKLLCYNWHALDGIGDSPLGRFAKKLAEAEPDAVKSWSEACVNAWNQYEELLPYGHKGIPEIYLIDEPNFGIVYARRSAGRERGIIYISNSASVGKRDKGAIAFTTEDRNWLMLIKETFQAQATDNAALHFPRRTEALIERDKKLYQAFQEQGNVPQPVKSQSCLPRLPNGERIQIQVFPGVFPVEDSWDTRYMMQAIDRVVPLLGELVRAGQISNGKGHPVAEIAGVDVGTGTGILALAMASHYEDIGSVVATDNYKPAVRNALFNFRMAAANYPSLCRPLGLQACTPAPTWTDYYVDDSMDRAAKMRVFDSVMKGQCCVVNCDLAERVYRHNDSEMMLIAFNYPAYQSPSNVFNTGGQQAGEPIVAKFLTDMKDRLRFSDVLLLPEITIREGGSFIGVGIENLAREHGYCTLQIDAGSPLPASDNGRAGGFVRVFALARLMDGGKPQAQHHPVLSKLSEKLSADHDHEIQGAAGYPERAPPAA